MKHLTITSLFPRRVSRHSSDDPSADSHVTIDTTTRTCDESVFATRKHSVNGQWSMVKCSQRGFSLLELLMVTAIMALLASAGTAYYRGFTKTVELQSTTKVLVSDLGYMRSKAMMGHSNLKWGAHLVNVSGGKHYYELFSTATNYAAGTVTSTTTLPVGVNFSNPAAGATQDIIFNKISGGTLATTTALVSEETTQVITISSIGGIY